MTLQLGDIASDLPSVSDAEAQERFRRGWRALRPYLRLTADPRLTSDLDWDRTG